MEKHGLTDYFEIIFDALVDHWRKILAAAAGVAVISTGVFGYRTYRRGIEQAAYQDFVGALASFNGSVTSTTKKADDDKITFATNEEKWQTVETNFARGYENHRSSALAGAFQLFRAEALIQQGKLDEAIAITRLAVESLSSREVADFYRVKLALMLIDQGTDASKQEGLHSLEMLAADQHGSAESIALYRLGEYFWTMQNFDRAKGYWQQFVGKFGDESTLSAQIDDVKQKLSLLVV